MVSLLIKAISLVVGIAFALIYDGIDRKLHARMQKRVGPPIRQSIYDFFKLLTKENLIPHSANLFLFNLIPFLTLFFTALSFLLLPIGGQAGGDLVLFFYFAVAAGLLFALAGNVSGNPYASIGSAREVSLLIGYEMPVILSAVTVAIKYSSLSLVTIAGHPLSAFSSVSLFLAFIAYLMALPVELGIVPFDIAEAETEVMSGPLIEYSGRNLAFLTLSRKLKKIVFAFFGAFVFLSAGPVLTTVAALVLLLYTTFVRTVLGRIKIDQALNLCWKYPMAISIIGVVAAAVGL